MNQRFEGTYHLHRQGQKSVEQETRVLAGDKFLRNVGSHATQRYIPQDGNFDNYRFESLKSYTVQKLQCLVGAACDGFPCIKTLREQQIWGMIASMRFNCPL
jgi:hypothetical protein